MPHGHLLAIYQAVLGGLALFGRQVRHNLVPMEIKINPLIAGAALGAAQELAIKGACGIQAVYGKGEMRWGVWGAHSQVINERLRASPLYHGEGRFCKGCAKVLYRSWQQTAP